MSNAMEGIQVEEADNHDRVADFDLYSRLQLIRFLSEINPTDETTKDEFFIDLVKNFTGNSMKDLLPHYIHSKGEKLRQIPLMGVTALPFQLELFHRASLQPSNSIIYLPSRCGKSLVGYMSLKYLMQQYADKKAIFLAPTTTEVILHGLSFLETTATPRNSVSLVTTLDKASQSQLKEAKVVFTTMALYLEMLTSKAILLHHCSLLVLDEVQLSLTNREYLEFHHDHWYEEMVTFRPRILGLLGDPVETLEIAPWIASLEALYQKWDADLYTSAFPAELAHIQRISWFGERQFNSCTDIPSFDATASAVVSEYLKSAVSILVLLHQTLLKESTRINPTSTFSTASSYSELQPYPSSSYYNELLSNLSTLHILVTSGDQDFSLQSRISPMFSRLLARLVSSAPTSIMKLLAKHIKSAWEALESIYIFGASFSLPLLRSLLDILQPDDEASYTPIYRTFIFQLNSEKERLEKSIRAITPNSQPHGRAASLLDSIRSYPGTPKIWVIVQNEATADTVADFLSQRLPLATDARSLRKKSAHVINAYKSGECRILVVPLAVEMEQIQGTIPAAHFIIHLDGSQTCRSLISNRFLSDSVSSSASNIFIGSAEEMEALSVLAAEDEFIFASVRSFCDPEGVERDEVDVEEEFQKYHELATRRVHGPLPSISPMIAPRRANPGNSAATRPPTGHDGYSRAVGGSGHPSGFPSPMPASSPHPPAFLQQGGMHEGYAPSGHFGPIASQSQFYPPQAYPAAPSPVLPTLSGINQSLYGRLYHLQGDASATSQAPTPTSSLGSASGINYVGKLQEHFQKLGKSLPHYEEISGGHGTNHFVQECSVAGMKALGEGQTKKAAKTDSAYKMLLLLRIIK